MTPWSRSAINAMHVLYEANWRWHAIAAHCGAIDGVTRSPGACSKKAHACGFVKPERLHTALADDRYDGDLADMMMMDYSVPRMTRELARQYGRQFRPSFVWQRLSQADWVTYCAWRKRAAERHSRGLTGINRKGQGRKVA